MYFKVVRVKTSDWRILSEKDLHIRDQHVKSFRMIYNLSILNEWKWRIVSINKKIIKNSKLAKKSRKKCDRFTSHFAPLFARFRANSREVARIRASKSREFAQKRAKSREIARSRAKSHASSTAVYGKLRCLCILYL